MPTYTKNIPQGSNRPSNDRALMKDNFEEIDTVVKVNHVAFNEVGKGKHKFLQMPEQSSAPTTAADEGGLYTKEAGGVTELFFRRESNGAEVQITGSSGSSVIELQGKKIIFASASSARDTNITFPDSGFSAAPKVVITAVFNSNNSIPSIALSQGNITSTTFQFKSNNSSTLTIHYMAIGTA